MKKEVTRNVSKIFQLNQQQTTSEELNGFINNSPIYVTSLTATSTDGNNPKQQLQPVVSCGGDVVLTQQFPDGEGKPAAVVQNDVRVVTRADHHQLLAARESLEVTRRSTTDRRASSPFQNGRTELLIGNEDNKVKTTAVVESNNNKLGIEPENR